MTDTETAFLAARAEAHCARLNVHTAVHAATCSCGRKPTYCSRCDETFSSWSLTFFDGQFFCGDCLDETGIQQIAESEDNDKAANAA